MHISTLGRWPRAPFFAGEASVNKHHFRLKRGRARNGGHAAACTQQVAGTQLAGKAFCFYEAWRGPSAPKFETSQFALKVASARSARNFGVARLPFFLPKMVAFKRGEGEGCPDGVSGWLGGGKGRATPERNSLVAVGQDRTVDLQRVGLTS